VPLSLGLLDIFSPESNSAYLTQMTSATLWASNAIAILMDRLCSILANNLSCGVPDAWVLLQ
jgi:hypothetical protein